MDHNGKIYLPYLHDWNEVNSDLLGLIQVCIIVFSEQPPVFARSSQPAPPPPQQQPAQSPAFPGYPAQPPTSLPSKRYFKLSLLLCHVFSGLTAGVENVPHLFKF